MLILVTVILRISLIIRVKDTMVKDDIVVIIPVNFRVFIMSFIIVNSMIVRIIIKTYSR